jgi:D-serine deaminase-like pyridoxal phosphate-dependent protein
MRTVWKTMESYRIDRTISDHMEISLTQGRLTSTDVFARAIIRDIFAAGLHLPVKENRER